MKFHLIGVPGILALLCSWGLAAAVLLTGPGLRRDRLLALLLFVEGTAWGSGAGVLYMTESPQLAWYVQAVFVAMLMAMPGCVLAFIGTLATSFVAPFNSRTGLAVIAVATVGAELFFLSHPNQFVGTIVPAWYATWDADLPTVTIDIFNVVGAVGIVSLAASLSSWARSVRGSAARRQARAFAIAFGVHDVGMFVALILPGHWVPPPPSGNLSDIFVILGCTVTSIVFVLLLSYGILKVQLFDIDLRIKHGIRRSTVVGVFVATFLVIEQFVQNFFNGQFGLLAGAVVAGLMLFGLSYIRRFAEALASKAMPDVSASQEYVTYRKLEVYRAALEGLYADAVVNEKERATLERLCVKLGIQRNDALAMEQGVKVNID